MKVLLDENMPTKARYEFGAAHEVFTVRGMGWLGKKNGELLGLAAFNGFDVLITLDKNLRHQQNLDKFNLKFILLLANDNKIQTIEAFVPKIKSLLDEVELPKFSEVK